MNKHVAFHRLSVGCGGGGGGGGLGVSEEIPERKLGQEKASVFLK